jgi:hypothetical protein
MELNFIQIQMQVKAMHKIKLFVNMWEALTSINRQPQYFEKEDNFIRFLILNHQKIEFHRIFANNWSMTIFSGSLSETFNNLNTNIVKVIVINLYHGNIIEKSLPNVSSSEIQRKSTEFNLWRINDYINTHLICDFCQQKLEAVDQERCSNCGNELNLTRFLYEHIF